ncbi:kinase-like protein [Xylariaceae sp. FL1651]|nr:kinase-like protein [Xylariaceae sp. FL1651]
MADKSQADISFSKEVLRLRAEYEHRHLHRGDKSYMTYWFDDGTKYGQCVRIFDVPGHFEIDGDDIRSLNCCLEHPELIEDDSEDVSEPVSKLPLVCVDPAKHFVKKGKYRSEIENLIRCQDSSRPGHLLSLNVIQPLGRSGDGQLVFEKLSSSARAPSSWILQLIDALDCLHLVGIVHRDLRADNILFSDDGERLVVCDLESRWGARSAPEIAFQGGLEDSGWTPRYDIYDIGNCIKSMIYANGPNAVGAVT